ncbi:V-type proton ATPase subunit F-like [Schistocerca serialis cubense]|uniref:V-type proton ATPase subunit F-like n=1 Tax=Schistocerca serialis cubense TaxID=2023355 RepID=UPI00214EB10A|nr:V-type proton ATPase subunit F-like [Schistocerca serialis cubense]
MDGPDPVDILVKATGPRKVVFDTKSRKSQDATAPASKQRDEEGAIWDENLLVGLMGDENTCVGFLLAGIGQRSPDGDSNVIVVHGHTSELEIEEDFQRLLAREDIAILLITDQVAEVIANSMARHLDSRKPPVLLTIPSPYQPFDSEADVMLRAVRRLRATEGEGEGGGSGGPQAGDAEDFR